jgi:methionyl-tRNA formyltransferase
MARIVFMGTPEFAVPILEALTKTPHVIPGVFTRPDQPAGRGKKIQPSPVKVLAESRGLPILQPKSFRRPEAADALRNMAPDLVVVAAFGLILPSDVLAIPARGSVNTHASLLPRHRGAAPIMAAILAGDSETGITLMQMDPGLDTGPILAQRAIPVDQVDTTGTLTPKLARVAADLLIETLPRILAGEIVPHPQDETQATVFRTIRKEEGLIDWTRPAIELARRVRAFNPWPSAYTFWNGLSLKVLRASTIPSMPNAPPGQVIQNRDEIVVATGDGGLVLQDIQLSGKRAMGIDDFVRGQRDFVGSMLKNA